MQDRVQTLKTHDGSPASLLVFYSCTEESVAYIGPSEVDSDHSSCYNSKSAQCAAYHPLRRLQTTNGLQDHMFHGTSSDTSVSK